MSEQPHPHADAIDKIDAIEAEINRLNDIIARYSRENFDQENHESDTKAETDYHRPLTGWLAWLNRFLGPLPENARVIDPVQTSIDLVPRHRIWAGLTALGAMALIITLAVLFPALRVSPLSLISNVAHHYLHGAWAGLAVGIAFALLMRLVMRISSSGALPTKGKMLDRFAMGEEQWFRMGAESWTVRQRIQSCVVFGFIHIQNLFYPLTSLIAVSLVGGLFMALYLSYYRKTGDYRLATLYSARFHATYNRFAFLVMGIGILSYTILYFVA